MPLFNSADASGAVPGRKNSAAQTEAVVREIFSRALEE